MKPIDKLNYLYEKYGHQVHSLHDLLWQLLMNEKFIDRVITLTVIVGNNEIGIAEKGLRGYTPTPAMFITQMYTEAAEICYELNAELFGQSKEESLMIVLNSMKPFRPTSMYSPSI